MQPGSSASAGTPGMVQHSGIGVDAAAMHQAGKRARLGCQPSPPPCPQTPNPIPNPPKLCSGHVFINQGVPKSNSGWFASCVDTLVDPDTDLVFVEFAVNDQHDADETSIQRCGGRAGSQAGGQARRLGMGSSGAGSGRGWGVGVLGGGVGGALPGRDVLLAVYDVSQPACQPAI